MSFPILFLGWFLIVFAASWPVYMGCVLAVSVVAFLLARASGKSLAPKEHPLEFGPFAAWFVRAAWSFLLALGIALVSTADLRW